jgi:hypothetical protein
MAAENCASKLHGSLLMKKARQKPRLCIVAYGDQKVVPPEKLKPCVMSALLFDKAKA